MKKLCLSIIVLLALLMPSFSEEGEVRVYSYSPRSLIFYSTYEPLLIRKWTHQNWFRITSIMPWDKGFAVTLTPEYEDKDKIVNIYLEEGSTFYNDRGFCTVLEISSTQIKIKCEEKKYK